MPLSRLSTLNMWLLDYTFLDFYTSVSSECIPQEWDYSTQRAFVPKIPRHPAWPVHRKAACVPSRLPQTIPCLCLPTAAQPRDEKSSVSSCFPFSVAQPWILCTLSASVSPPFLWDVKEDKWWGRNPSFNWLKGVVLLFLQVQEPGLTQTLEFSAAQLHSPVFLLP